MGKEQRRAQGKNLSLLFLEEDARGLHQPPLKDQMLLTTGFNELDNRCQLIGLPTSRLKLLTLLAGRRHNAMLHCTAGSHMQQRIIEHVAHLLPPIHTVQVAAGVE